MPNTRLVGKRALVIGGSSGIGRAVSRRFAAEGARVAVADLREEPREGGTATAEQIVADGGEALFAQCDLTDEASTAAAFRTVAERLDGLEVTFVAAGMAEPVGDTREIPLDAFDRHMRLNLRGTFIAVQQALRIMVPRRRGTIIVVASNFGQVGVAGMAAYCASKAAVIGMVKSVAVETGQYSVTINALCPGATKTQINVSYRADPVTQELWQRMTPLRMEDGEYIAETRDMAAAAAYLASDEARFMTGAQLTVDGGWTAH
ncbi:SDR family NAD(P)-dependent oxidoreductase [Georgenia sp. AZ-5]|uniref:SDR family NAD(P)-dependent oxidoreductase n=1 Tax=Georgenia sp. AZ-5 TaxID=3367526 RepID=UPI003754DBB4